MATLLNCKAISKHFGTHELFSNLSISFADDEHVGMFGPNGSGKTTFLKMLAGQLDPDSGEVERRRTARIGFLPQQDIFGADDTVGSALIAALAGEEAPRQATSAAHRDEEEHEREIRVNILLTKFGFADPNRPVRELSGGWRKRLAIAREVIQQPDILLMDEPTNHLDLAGIEWLEEMLLAAPFAFLAVSHDRYFLERVTDRVVELNPIYPEGYFSASGSYSQFLDKRAEYFEARQAQEATLSNIVRREAAFLKSHAKAQRTKTKFRTEEAHRLVDELKELKSRNAQTRTAGIEFAATGRQSKKLLEAKDIAKSMGGRLLFKDVSVFLSPGTRLGLIGLNGSGKTTLIRVLTGTLPPDAGTIQRADDLRIVIFDQMREALPQDVPLRRALAGQAEAVEFSGRKIHITAWAKRFLFRQDQMDMPVKDLSGGEQARIQIARLMLRPADLLVLDEPTNDLDIGSLDVLEESLLEFPGAIVLVTHDRFMLDRVSTEILGLDGDGRVGKYTSAAHWQEAQARLTSTSTAKSSKAGAGGSAEARSGKATDAKPAKPKTKVERTGLTASEAKELKEMESTIQEADEQVAECEKAVSDPSVAGDLAEVQKRWAALESARQHLQTLYTRWEELEAKAK